ncbi:MAG: 50S ribosomal protein L15 [bacterium]
MQLHQIKPKHKRPKRKKVGRGGKRGTYSGRGMKGQKSRAGRRMKPVVRELIKRYPKLRGYRFKVKTEKSQIVTLNLEVLDKVFNSGDKITPEALLEKKLINKIKGRKPKVKILGQGKLTKDFNFEGCQFSKTAKEKIEKAGGAIV